MAVLKIALVNMVMKVMSANTIVLKILYLGDQFAGLPGSSDPSN